MELKQIENFELLVSKMKENNSPYLEQFPSLKEIDFAAVKAGEKKLSDFVTDARLVEIARKLNIALETNGAVKSRDVLLEEVITLIKAKIEEKGLTGIFGKIAFWKKKNK